LRAFFNHRDIKALRFILDKGAHHSGSWSWSSRLLLRWCDSWSLWNLSYIGKLGSIKGFWLRWELLGFGVVCDIHGFFDDFSDKSRLLRNTLFVASRDRNGFLWGFTLILPRILQQFSLFLVALRIIWIN